MTYTKKDKNFFKFLAKEIKNRDNPTDLKQNVIGFVTNIEPLTVSTDGDSFVFIDGEDLFVSEQFRLRCKIDETTALSSDVPNLLNKAKQVTETHSNGGSPCNMPQAIEKLAQAIEKVNTELLQLKCDLKVGDKVVLAPLNDMHGAYIVLDKIL